MPIEVGDERGSFIDVMWGGRCDYRTYIASGEGGPKAAFDAFCQWANARPMLPGCESRACELVSEKDGLIKARVYDTFSLPKPAGVINNPKKRT